MARKATTSARVSFFLICFFHAVHLVNSQNCTICQDDRVVLNPSQPLAKGGTCGEVDALVKALSTDQCSEISNDIIVAGIRCGCRDDTQFPVCENQQNSQYCTTGLLEAAGGRLCECYRFCGRNFNSCDSFPGGRLTSSTCGESVPVTGCNSANAIEGPNPFLLCPGICPDGSVLENPNRVIPSITLVPNFFVPTCQQADDYLKSGDGIDCTFVQSLAGYCGCREVVKQDKCSFCPPGQESQNLEFKTFAGFTCFDLVDYVEYLSEKDCNRTAELSERFRLDQLQEQCQCTPVTPNPTAAPTSSVASMTAAPTQMPTAKETSNTLDTPLSGSIAAMPVGYAFATSMVMMLAFTSNLC